MLTKKILLEVTYADCYGSPEQWDWPTLLDFDGDETVRVMHVTDVPTPDAAQATMRPGIWSVDQPDDDYTHTSLSEFIVWSEGTIDVPTYDGTMQRMPVKANGLSPEAVGRMVADAVAGNVPEQYDPSRPIRVRFVRS